MIKIKSITDVITNSSTEVYTFVDEYGKENLKKFITGILKASGSDKTCDDVFRIRYELRYSIHVYWEAWEQELIDLYCRENKVERCEFYSLNITEEEKRNCIEKFIETNETDWDGIPSKVGFVIEPIDPLGNSIPGLDLINRIFDAKEFYI